MKTPEDYPGRHMEPMKQVLIPLQIWSNIIFKTNLPGNVPNLEQFNLQNKTPRWEAGRLSSVSPTTESPSALQGQPEKQQGKETEGDKYYSSF